MTQSLDMVVYELTKEMADTVVGQVKDIVAKSDMPVNSVKGASSLQAVGYDSHVYFVGVSSKKQDGIDFVMRLREKNSDAYVVFMIDTPDEVTLCVKPGTKPDGVLFRPPEIGRLAQCIVEIYRQLLTKDAQEDNGCLTIKAGAQYYKLSHRDIYFFEARNKKIAVRTAAQEILFYSNFETVLEKLPDYFFKCHKGYIVNTKHIRKIDFADMVIELTDQCMVPFSRSYKDKVKQLTITEGQG